MGVKISQSKLHEFITSLFNEVGVPKEEAKMVADVLMKAELRGIKSHGVSRIPIYIKRLELGVVSTKSNLTILKETACTALLDGGYGLGQVLGTKAMRIAIEKAEATGIGMVGLNKSHHYGIAAFFSEMAIKHNMIGFSCCNTKAMMPPPGGASRAIGNNPFSFAFPSGEQLPVIFDCACSTVAEGKIIVSKNAGKSIPEGWALDVSGNPTTDPSEALKGFILPAGGPKGYGMAVVMELLSGVLTKAATGTHLTSIYADVDKPQNCGNFFAAIKIDAFDDVEDFKKRMDAYILDLKNSKRAKGVEQIYMPGEIELRNEIKLGESDLEISDESYLPLKELANKYKLDI